MTLAMGHGSTNDNLDPALIENGWQWTAMFGICNTLHLVSTRCFLTNLLGGQATEPHPELFAEGKGLETDGTYPTIADSLASFNEASAKLNDTLASATPEFLNTEAPFPVPTGKTLGDMVAFLAHHEAYHIGQIGILRRVFERDAMSYS